MKEYKKIGIFTTGGDCPGLNAALHAVALRGWKQGLEILGIKRGLYGLFDDTHIVSLNEQTFPYEKFYQGGSFLGNVSKRIDSKTIEEKRDPLKIRKRCNELNLDGLIIIGGDGSAKVSAPVLKEAGIPLVMIPKTIDNDLSYTQAIGYETAVNVVADAAENLYTTGLSHHRVMVLEVMGRDVGHIAIASGIAGAADAILVPECTYNVHVLCDRVQTALHKKGVSLVVVSESIKNLHGQTMVDDHIERYKGAGVYIASLLAQHLPNEDVRSVVLGHLQRGARPCARDKILATALGSYGVDALLEGYSSHMVLFEKDRLSLRPIEDVIRTPHALYEEHILVKTAKNIGIYIGDFV